MLALKLYFTTPFGKIHSKNPTIINLANKISRSPGAVALKMSNFAALDPTIDRKGMGNYSKSDAVLWEEFFENPAQFLDRLEGLDVDELTYSSHVDDNYSDDKHKVGEDVPILTTRRRNQNFFRATILAAYNGKCAMTKISQQDLLIASHILPWSKFENERLNPRNGILLNALHDRAFDKGLITFGDGLELITSKSLELNDMARPFFDKRKLELPEKFGPDPAFLAYHRENIFLS